MWSWRLITSHFFQTKYIYYYMKMSIWVRGIRWKNFWSFLDKCVVSKADTPYHQKRGCSLENTVYVVLLSLLNCLSSTEASRISFSKSHSSWSAPKPLYLAKYIFTSLLSTLSLFSLSILRMILDFGGFSKGVMTTLTCCLSGNLNGSGLLYGLSRLTEKVGCFLLNSHVRITSTAFFR